MFRYDSGKRLTANGGVMDMNVVPVDEERLEEDLPGKLRWAMEHDAESS